MDEVIFLQFRYALANREPEQQVNMPLACKWFVGLLPEETGPHHWAGH